LPSKVVPRIVEAAAQLFAENGYAGTSTHQIAMAADVSEESLFRLFSSKEKLFEAALEYAVRHWRLQADDFERELSRPDIVIAIHKATALYHAKTKPEYFRLLLFAALKTGKGIRPGTGYTVELIVPLVRRLEQGKDEGQVALGLDASLAAMELSRIIVALHVFDFPSMKPKVRLAQMRECVDSWLYGVLRRARPRTVQKVITIKSE